MNFCSQCNSPIQKGDTSSKLQCPQNDKETIEMVKVAYAFDVDSLMYA